MNWARRLTAVATSVAITSGGLFLVVLGPSAAAPAAASGPSCTFGPHAISAIVAGVTPGETITISCRGLTATNPYLLVTSSLLVAIDPAAKPLLTGSITTEAGILAAVSALPEMNALSEETVLSDGSGNLNTTYTVPTTQALDPNATCPESTEQFNSGLIGCAVAMIDLVAGKPVTAGTAVLNYASHSGFPTKPTLALSPSTAHTGQSVSLSDAAGATNYWWLATLASIVQGLSGSPGGGAIPVTVKEGPGKTISSAGVSPASYNGSVFTPPKLAGTFVAKGHGKKKVTVTLAASLEGFGLSNVATQVLHVLR